MSVFPALPGCEDVREVSKYWRVLVVVTAVRVDENRSCLGYRIQRDFGR